MRRVIAPLLVLLLILTPVLCTADRSERQGDAYGPRRKDPILAGALSWYVPGLGQMYSGAILKGAAFFVVEETLLVSTVLTFAEIKLDVTGNVGLGINIKSKSDPDSEDRQKAVILGITLLAVHFINVIDAVNTTRKHNRELEPYLSFGADRDEAGSAYSLSLNKPF
jgi:TM2 domain-containing membrane protein YozV